MTGIEPALSAWEADVLPLNYIRRSRWVLPPGGALSRPRSDILQDRELARVRWRTSSQPAGSPVSGVGASPGRREKSPPGARGVLHHRAPGVR